MLKHTFIGLFAIALVASCSRKKDKFLNRAYHSITTEYNILYNGGLAFEAGKTNLKQNYNDNYWEILPIEPLEISENLTIGKQSVNIDFQIAEDKAIKAIQKHSIRVKGKEKNPQIDEAYMLLGKARYHDGRFIPALEAFNFILFKYPSSSNINLAKIWREKTNLRLQNEELAITNLKRLLKNTSLSKANKAEASATLAQAYINTKALDSAVVQLEEATKLVKNKHDLGRLRFIQGQLYSALGQKDSANLTFDKVIALNWKIPRRYWVAAQLEKVKNFDYQKSSKQEMKAFLLDLENDRENRPYLDKIFHQIGMFHLLGKEDSTAITYFNNSLRSQTNDKFLTAINYKTIGDIRFDQKNFVEAGAYFDSTLTNLDSKSKLFRTINRKRENLEDLIYYEGVVQTNDSVLRIARMTEGEQVVFFQAYIEQLEQQELETQQTENTKKQKTARNLPSTTFGGNKTFYFYNTTSVSSGEIEFTKLWGERDLVDNWRWLSTNKGSNASVDLSLSKQTEPTQESKVASLLLEIPTSKSVLDSLVHERNFAYYQLGLIYKNKFKELELAKDRLNTLLKHNPKERLILPTNYNLYKIYTSLGEESNAKRIKDFIIASYPDSRYASILLNPDSNIANASDSPQAIYQAAYKAFETGNYQAVIDQCEELIIQFDGDEIAPKLELLKATAKAKLFGFEAYKEGINFVALNYPNSPEGEKAQAMIDTVLPQIEDRTFVDDKTDDNFKVVFKFSTEEKEQLASFHEALDKAVKTVQYFDLTTSKDQYTPSTTFVVVHGLKSIDGAQGFAELLEEDYKDLDYPFFGISSKNYQTLQIHKNLEDYLEQ